MEVRHTHVWLGTLSLAAVMWLLYVHLDRTAPGPLSPAHSQVKELLALENCALCHGDWDGDMGAACSACHEEVAADIRAGKGFHGTLTGVDPEDCGSCHQEHFGADFPLVSVKSFARAGFPRREAFDHASLDFELAGAHTLLGCAECHSHADILVLLEGQRRFQGLDQDCASCHEDVHEGRIVRECASCHGQEHPFALVASFEHRSFTTDCAHAKPSCVECHPTGSQHDSELLAGADPPDCERTCLDCHTSPHSLPFVTAVAALADVPEGATCASCHSEAHSGFAGHQEAMPASLHAASGFPLDQPHNAVTCGECHSEVAGDVIVSFAVHEPTRSADDCVACHDDAHDGQFDDGTLWDEGCLACHERTAFEPSSFGLDQHAATAFPLTGSHEAVACTRCHQQPDSEEPRTFRGTAASCESCHEDAHRGLFVEAANAFPAEAEGCTHCHEPTLFSEFREAAFDHGAWTGFALAGAHERAECEACHRRSADADEAGRTFGFAAQIFGEPVEACATCHDDPHAGVFDRAELPASVQQREGCERCHADETFSRTHIDTQAPGWHERWTLYPIADFHAEVACQECHVPAPSPDAFGREFGRAGTECADCHEDPHVGQFVGESGVADCARCHLDSGGLAFDHDRDSRFPLDEQHSDLACSACHVPWPVPGGGETIRYKPLGTECADCHDPLFLDRARTETIRRGERAGFTTRGGDP